MSIIRLFLNKWVKSMQQTDLSLPKDAVHLIKTYLLGLQKAICDTLESLDNETCFKEDVWTRPDGGGGLTRICLCWCEFFTRFRGISPAVSKPQQT
jgi:hypothetical protein